MRESYRQSYAVYVCQSVSMILLPLTSGEFNDETNTRGSSRSTINLTSWKALSEERTVRSLKPADLSNLSTIDREPVPHGPVAIELLDLIHTLDIIVCRLQLLRLAISLGLHLHHMLSGRQAMRNPLLAVPDRTGTTRASASRKNHRLSTTHHHDAAWCLKEAGATWIDMGMSVTMMMLYSPSAKFFTVIHNKQCDSFLQNPES